ncbi:accessory gene regulator ArgB-like protein [Clostridioides difficile]
MIESCANKITSFLIINKTIEQKEYDLYLYGFKTLIAFIVNIIVILFTGYVLNRFKETALFLLCYCPIRQFTGGYHADDYKKCLLSFILIYLTNIYLIESLMSKKLDYIIIIIMCISYIGIYFLSPLEHRNNPLSKKEKQKYRKIAVCLISIVLLFSIIGVNFNITYRYSIYAASVIICIFTMLILGLIKQQGRSKK